MENLNIGILYFAKYMKQITFFIFMYQKKMHS